MNAYWQQYCAATGCTTGPSNNPDYLAWIAAQWVAFRAEHPELRHTDVETGNFERWLER